MEELFSRIARRSRTSSKKSEASGLGVSESNCQRDADGPRLSASIGHFGRCYLDT